ncbi:MFS transporter [Streptomyces echinoruber]
MFLGQVAFYSVPVQVPFLVEDHFHAGSVASGAVIAVQTLTTGLVSLRFAAIRRLAGEYGLVSAAFAGIAVGYLVLSLAPHVAVLALGTLVMGMGLGVLMPTLNGWVVNEAPPEARSRYTGFLTTALFLGQFLAPIVTQPLVRGLGIQPMFLVVAAGALLVAAGYLAGGRRWTVRADRAATAHGPDEERGVRGGAPATAGSAEEHDRHDRRDRHDRHEQHDRHDDRHDDRQEVGERHAEHSGHAEHRRAPADGPHRAAGRAG